MSNSAFTPTFAQNLQDASTTQKGLVNTTTQTFAGKKTFDGGAAIKGDTSGSAVAAGYVGEIQSATKTSTTVGSTTRASYTTLVTLSNLPAGVWKLEATLPYYSITGAGGDSGGVSYGATFSARIYNSTDAAIVASTSANTARSVTNSGYVAGGNVTLLATVNIITAKTYVFDFAFESNSGTNNETITAIQVGAASIAPVILRAIRIA